MGKKPLNEQQVKTLRKIVSDKPLHELTIEPFSRFDVAFK